MLTNGNKKIAVVYLLWSSEPEKYLPRAIEGMKKQTYPKDKIEFLIVYNSHKPDEPSQCPYIRLEIEKNQSELPHTTFIEQEKNLGFSGGNNFGMQWAIDNGFDYVFLHNGDGFLGDSCLEKLVEVMDSDNKIGAAQSFVLLYPETELINTAGNCAHYLGLGYCDDYRKVAKTVQLPKVKDIGYASGAAIMMRTDLLKQYGLWDQDFFMYHEDYDYSFRLKSLGYRVVLASEAVFYHQYTFVSRSVAKYFWMERNRFVFLLLYYKWLTLVLILPMLLVLEVGMFLFSVAGGWWREKIKVYAYWLKRNNWNLWLKKRQQIMRSRKVGDRELLKTMVPAINFDEKSVANPILHYIGNPLMWIYYQIFRLIIWW